MEKVGKAVDLKAGYGTKRQRLFGACARARGFRRIRGVGPASEELGGGERQMPTCVLVSKTSSKRTTKAADVDPELGPC